MTQKYVTIPRHIAPVPPPDAPPPLLLDTFLNSKQIRTHPCTLSNSNYPPITVPLRNTTSIQNTSYFARPVPCAFSNTGKLCWNNNINDRFLRGEFNDIHQNFSKSNSYSRSYTSTAVPMDSASHFSHDMSESNDLINIPASFDDSYADPTTNDDLTWSPNQNDFDARIWRPSPPKEIIQNHIENGTEQFRTYRSPSNYPLAYGLHTSSSFHLPIDLVRAPLQYSTEYSHRCFNEKSSHNGCLVQNAYDVNLNYNSGLQRTSFHNVHENKWYFPIPNYPGSARLSTSEHLFPAFEEITNIPKTPPQCGLPPTSANNDPVQRKTLPSWLRDELKRLRKQKTRCVPVSLSTFSDCNTEDECRCDFVGVMESAHSPIEQASSSPPMKTDNEVEFLGATFASSPESNVLSEKFLENGVNLEDITEAEFQTAFKNLPEHVKKFESAQFITRTLTDALLNVTTNLVVDLAKEALSEAHSAPKQADGISFSVSQSCRSNSSSSFLNLVAYDSEAETTSEDELEHVSTIQLVDEFTGSSLNRHLLKDNDQIPLCDADQCCTTYAVTAQVAMTSKLSQSENSEKIVLIQSIPSAYDLAQRTRLSASSSPSSSSSTSSSSDCRRRSRHRKHHRSHKHKSKKSSHKHSRRHRKRHKKLSRRERS